MLLSHFVAWTFPVSMMVLGAGVVSAQTYPNKSIRLLTNGVGGGADFVARMIAQGLTGSLGQQVVVDNRPNGTIPTEIVAKAAPDGYTLHLNSNGMWTLPLLRSRVPYDPVRDFLPITLATRTLNVLVVHPSLRVTSVRELIALAKSRPGELNYASGGTGSAMHLGIALFTSMAGVNIAHVPYKANSLAVNDLISGQVQMTIVSAGSVMQHVKGGRLKALAITSAQPSTLFPDLPTVAASGLPGYESATVYAVFAPAKTSEAIVTRLNQDIVRVINREDVKEKFFNAGIESIGSSPEQLAATIKSEMAKMGKVIKNAGMRDD